MVFGNYSGRNQTWDLLSGDSAVPNAGELTRIIKIIENLKGSDMIPLTFGFDRNWGHPLQMATCWFFSLATCSPPVKRLYRSPQNDTLQSLRRHSATPFQPAVINNYLSRRPFGIQIAKVKVPQLGHLFVAGIKCLLIVLAN